MREESASQPDVTEDQKHGERKMKTYLKVKIKSLTAEAKIIRLEEQRANPKTDMRANLLHHRRHVVRPETRASLLAYGFLRGREYKQIEQTRRTEPDWKRVQKMIEKYGSGDQRDLMQQFSEWKEAA